MAVLLGSGHSTYQGVKLDAPLIGKKSLASAPSPHEKVSANPDSAPDNTGPARDLRASTPVRPSPASSLVPIPEGYIQCLTGSYLVSCDVTQIGYPIHFNMDLPLVHTI